MTRIYVPSRRPEDWQQLLADPVKHWRTGYSAKALAHCWQNAAGLPPEIARLLEAYGADPELLIALPEHKVPLPGSSRGESQNDLLALARAGGRTLAITVEGKVGESFGEPLGAWLENASDGKRERLAYLCDQLGLTPPLPNDIHYQLLHRTAAAVIEARRFKTDAAAMIVHSFSSEKRWFEAFSRFVSLLGCTPATDKLIALRPDASPPLYVGWACGDTKFLTA